MQKNLLNFLYLVLVYVELLLLRYYESSKLSLRYFVYLKSAPDILSVVFGLNSIPSIISGFLLNVSRSVGISVCMFVCVCVDVCTKLVLI